jgi:hypothetical protein
MDPLFVCPPPATLASIPTQACPERFGQILRIAFQRKQGTSSFTSATIKVAGTWTPLLTASDSTKLIITPQTPGIVIPPGEILSEGGNDNTTINGIRTVTGRGYVPVTAQLKDVNAAVRTAIRALFSESGGGFGTNLWAYFITADNLIIANSDGSGVDAYNVIVGDVGTEGFARPNIAHMAFDLAPGWSDSLAVFTPTAPFKPLNL